MARVWSFLSLAREIEAQQQKRRKTEDKIEKARETSEISIRNVEIETLIQGWKQWILALDVRKFGPGRHGGKIIGKILTRLLARFLRNLRKIQFCL